MRKEIPNPTGTDVELSDTESLIAFLELDSIIQENSRKQSLLNTIRFTARTFVIVAGFATLAIVSVLTWHLIFPADRGWLNAQELGELKIALSGGLFGWLFATVQQYIRNRM